MNFSRVAVTSTTFPRGRFIFGYLSLEWRPKPPVGNIEATDLDAFRCCCCGHYCRSRRNCSFRRPSVPEKEYWSASLSRSA